MSYDQTKQLNAIFIADRRYPTSDHSCLSALSPSALSPSPLSPLECKVSRPALSSLLNSKAGLSGEMALRIEKAFGVRMDTLMRMQSAYDIAQTRKREKEIRVRRIHHTADGHG